MRAETTPRVAYVVKRYPRFSETFVVNEILAHEAAGLSIEIFALYPPNDTHFQDALARVRAPVTYLSADGLRGADLWTAIEGAATEVPAIWRSMESAKGAAAKVVYQGAILAQVIRRRGITHVHAHFATVSAEVARLAADWAGVPYSVTAHAKDIFHETVTASGLRRVLADAAGVVTVSDFNVEYLVEQVGLSPEKVQRIYNGLDLTRFAFRPAQERPPRIVGVGRFVEKKGFSDLLRACSVLRRQGTLFTCELIGAGPEEAALRALSSELHLNECVRFSGPLPQSEVIEAVSGAAVFAAPCVVAHDGDRDGLPTVLLEAMALGTPVVATDVVGIPEIVHHEGTGLLVPQRDPDALAHALGRCLGSAALRSQLAVHARQHIEAAFDVCRNAAALRDIVAPATRPTMARAS